MTESPLREANPASIHELLSRIEDVTPEEFRRIIEEMRAHRVQMDAVEALDPKRKGLKDASGLTDLEQLGL